MRYKCKICGSVNPYDIWFSYGNQVACYDCAIEEQNDERRECLICGRIPETILVDENDEVLDIGCPECLEKRELKELLHEMEDYEEYHEYLPVYDPADYPR